MTTVSADCRFRPRPAARMDSRNMNAELSFALKRWMAFSLSQAVLVRYLHSGGPSSGMQMRGMVKFRNNQYDAATLGGF